MSWPLSYSVIVVLSSLAQIFLLMDERAASWSVRNNTTLDQLKEIKALMCESEWEHDWGIDPLSQLSSADRVKN